MRAGKDIIITGYAGSRGAAFLASENEELLRKRFRRDYLEEQLKLLKEDEALYMGSVCEKGILRALYDMAVENRCGISIEQKKIPVRQFTIEICELTGENPYRIPGRNIITVCDESESAGILNEMRQKGIPAGVIGKIIPGPKKIITDKTNIEYINKD